MIRRILLPFFVALIGYAFWPSLALAQSPEYCININGALHSSHTWDFTSLPVPDFEPATNDEWLTYFEDTLGVSHTFVGECADPRGAFVEGTGYVSSPSCQLSGYGQNVISFLVSPVTINATVPFTWSASYPDSFYAPVIGYHNDGTFYRSSQVGSGSLNAGFYDEINLERTRGSTASNVPGWQSLTIQCGNVEVSCSLVPNFDFTTTDDWSVTDVPLNEAYPAQIISDTLQLGPFDYARQNLNLQPNTTYNVTLAISNVIEITPTGIAVGVNVSLGTESSDLVYVTDGAGLYGTTLTTPDNLTGPILFNLEWYTEALGGYVIVDYVCLSPSSTGPGGEQASCIAPTNGEFTSADNWDFYRGASWSYLSQDVSLPVNTSETDSGLILTSSAFSLPTVITDSYLLLSFDAKSTNDDGLVGAKIDATSDFTGFFETYTIYYTYESDITSLAGENATLAFANAPTQTLYADITVDNACIFVSDRPPMLPYPTDPDSINPTQLGFGITSCAQVDGIWAWLGVNMAQYRANYAAGFSIWDDPLEWVVSAVFVTLADWSCLFMLALAALLNLIEFFLNNVLNIFNWLQGNFSDFVTWLDGMLNYIGASLANISNAYAAFLTAWSAWIGANLTIVSNWIGATLAAWSDWIGANLTIASNWSSNLTTWSNWIGATLAAWFDWIGANLTIASDWIGANLANWSDWIGANLANAAEWIGNTLSNLLPWLINQMSPKIVNLIGKLWAWFWGGIMDLGAFFFSFWVELWNSYIQPFLQTLAQLLIAPILLIIRLFELFFDLLLSLGRLAISIIIWAYENLIELGTIPIDIFQGFNDGLQSAGFDLVNCSGGSVWCYVLIGFDLLNTTVSPSIMYPFVIVGIIIMTVIILKERVGELVEFVLTTLRET